MRRILMPDIRTASLLAVSVLLLAACNARNERSAGSPSADRRERAAAAEYKIYLFQSMDRRGNVDETSLDRRPDEAGVRVTPWEHTRFYESSATSVAAGALAGSVAGVPTSVLAANQAPSGALTGAAIGGLVPSVPRWRVKSVPEGAKVLYKGQDIKVTTNAQLMNLRERDLIHLVLSLPGYKDCKYNSAFSTIHKKENGSDYSVYECKMAPDGGPDPR